MVNPRLSGSPFHTRVGTRAAEFPRGWIASGSRFPFSLGGSRGCTSRTVRSLIPLQHVSVDTFEPYRVDLHWPYCPCCPILTPPSASRRRRRVCACVRVGLSRRPSEDRSLLPDLTWRNFPTCLSSGGLALLSFSQPLWGYGAWRNHLPCLSV